MKEFLKDTKRAYEFFNERLSYIVSPFELKDMIKERIDELNIIDLRSYEDYMDSHIPYAVHAPYESFEEHLKKFDKEKINIVYAYSFYCKMATRAAAMLTKEGYPTMELKGGFKIWQKLDFETISNK